MARVERLLVSGDGWRVERTGLRFSRILFVDGTPTPEWRLLDPYRKGVGPDEQVNDIDRKHDEGHPLPQKLITADELIALYKKAGWTIRRSE